MTREDDIRRQHEQRKRDNDAARRMEQRARDKRLDDQRTRERRQQEKSALSTQEPLKRRTASEGAMPWRETKPRPAIKAKTTRRAGQEREYSADRKEYLEKNPECHHCLEAGNPNPLPSECVHHTAGRDDEDLLDPRFWMAVNSRCHLFYPGAIHVETGLSHEKGWLLTRSTPELELAELIEKRGDLDYVKRELENL